MERSRYKISEMHRRQSFVAVLRRDPESYSWSCKGHIDFVDDDSYSFTSGRSFATKVEAEDYLRCFVRARIDQHLDV